jgi:hypothetical protein
MVHLHDSVLSAKTKQQCGSALPWPGGRLGAEDSRGKGSQGERVQGGHKAAAHVALGAPLQGSWASSPAVSRLPEPAESCFSGSSQPSAMH